MNEADVFLFQIATIHFLYDVSKQNVLLNFVESFEDLREVIYEHRMHDIIHSLLLKYYSSPHYVSSGRSDPLSLNSLLTLRESEALEPCFCC